jgi:hypothetical protein
MFASVLIISISCVLLVYWFRYSCILLLRGHAQESSISNASERYFRLAAGGASITNDMGMDALHLALQRDHKLITYLLENAPGLELSSFEDKLLLWDYKAMQLWYKLTRVAAPDQARQALQEMSSVISVLGSKIGERAGIQQAEA